MKLAMKKTDLEHIIRAAAAITNQYEVIVIGSQSILGSVESPPQECLKSMEADIYVPGNDRFADIVDGAIGEDSPFHESFGYYAQGVDETTAILPDGWRDRLVRLQSQNTDGRAGFCLDVTDLFLAKSAANREKDHEFNLVLLRLSIVDPTIAMGRIPAMPLDDDGKKRVSGLVVRLAREAGITLTAQPLFSVVAEGAFSGRILDVSDGVAIQKTGRGDETARHLVSRLSQAVEIDDVVDIRYDKDGVGVVAGLCPVGKDVGR